MHDFAYELWQHMNSKRPIWLRVQSSNPTETPTEQTLIFQGWYESFIANFHDQIPNLHFALEPLVKNQTRIIRLQAFDPQTEFLVEKW